MLKSLKGFADAIGHSGPLLTDQTSKEDSAEWIGRMAAYVRTAGANSPGIGAAAERAYNAIDNHLPIELRAECARGSAESLLGRSGDGTGREPRFGAGQAEASRPGSGARRAARIETDRERLLLKEKRLVEAFEREMKSIQEGSSIRRRSTPNCRQAEREIE